VASDPDGDAITSLAADLTALPSGNDALFTTGPGTPRAPSRDPRAGGCPADRYGVVFTAANAPLRDCIVRGHGNQPGRPTVGPGPAGCERDGARSFVAVTAFSPMAIPSRPSRRSFGPSVGNRASSAPARGTPWNAFRGPPRSATPALSLIRSFSTARTPSRLGSTAITVAPLPAPGPISSATFLRVHDGRLNGNGGRQSRGSPGVRRSFRARNAGSGIGTPSSA